MHVVGAFAVPSVGDLVARAMTSLDGVDSFVSCGTVPEFVAACSAREPEAVVIGGAWLVHVPEARIALERAGASPPLWLALTRIAASGSDVATTDVGIATQIYAVALTTEGWRVAIEAARRGPGAVSDTVRIVTLFPSEVPHEALRGLLRTASDLCIVARCTSADSLSDAIVAHEPHIVVFGAPHFGDVAAARAAIHGRLTRAPAWALFVSHLDPATALAAAALPAVEVYTSVDIAHPTAIAASLRALAATGVLAGVLLDRARATLGVAQDDADRRILELLVTGAKNEDIAAATYLSTQTVKNRLSRMMKAVGVDNRTAMALRFAPQ